MKTSDSPGVHIPPPLMYAITFGVAVLFHDLFPISIRIFNSSGSHSLGWILISLSAGILITSLVTFAWSRNTLITIKAARSLQTKGIYAFTRNPMYLGLMVLYAGLACIFGNCWNFIFLPLLVFVIQKYVIQREEKYLERAFGEEYNSYRSRVRRWI